MAHRGTILLTYEERVEIEKLCSLKYKIQAIADILGRSLTCIKGELRKNYGRNHYRAHSAHQAFLSRHETSCIKRRKRFTEEQVSILENGIREGWSKNKLSEQMGASFHSVSAYFKHNNISYTPKNYTAFEDRITSLEMQIEILSEQIKEILNVIKQN